MIFPITDTKGNKISKQEFMELGRDEREGVITSLRKSYMGDSYGKVDRALWAHQDSPLRKGSVMVRIAVLKSKGASYQDTKDIVTQELINQWAGKISKMKEWADSDKSENRRFPLMYLNKPLQKERVASNQFEAAWRDVDDTFMTAFNKDCEMSRQYLKEWLGMDTVNVYRGSSVNRIGNAEFGGTVGFSLNKDIARKFGKVVFSKQVNIDDIGYAFDYKEGTTPLPFATYGEHEILAPVKSVASIKYDVYKSAGIDVSEVANVVEKSRRDQANKVDLSKTAITVLPKTVDGLRKWVQSPNRYDLAGIDTKKPSNSRKPKARHKSIGSARGQSSILRISR